MKISSYRVLPNKQRAYSIVELLVAMLLAIILTTGVYTTLISNQKSYQAVRSSQILTNKKWVVTSLIRTFVRHAGWLPLEYVERNVDGNLNLDVAIADDLYWEGPIKSTIVGSDNANEIISDGLPDSDILSFPLFGTNTDYVIGAGLRGNGAAGNLNQQDDFSNDGLVKCDGRLVQIDSTGLLITFYINKSRQLICHDRDSGKVIIDNNVEQMQVLYGLSTGGYVPAAQLTPADSVNRIKIALLISEEIVRNTDMISAIVNYDLLGKIVTVEPDNSYREVVTETILFRNPSF